jgi:N-acetylglutamate synthase-like GNAT family acetyltransferase
MAKLVEAEGWIAERILDDTYSLWHDGLTRPAYGRFFTAQIATAWGRKHLQRFALVEGGEVVASAKLYRFDAVHDGQPVRVAGLGAVFTAPAVRGRGAARELIDQLLQRAAADGADFALLFSEIGPDYYARLGFVAIATKDVHLRVTESTRYGAPMTMVRGGDDRDLADIVAQGLTRAAPYRFHLARDRDLVQFAIAKKRLFAGLSPSGLRALQFFIAEEGASAVAYVVISVYGEAWTIEEMGDRDPSGARVGAILQTLIAREPAQTRPSIRAWLPHGFLPPQVNIVGEQPSAEVMMIKSLNDRARGLLTSPLASSDIMYWRADLF